jgi:ribose 1,5-bisphosphokinase PhnN
MSELLELYRQLTPNARREFDFAMTIINAAMTQTPAERLSAYDRQGATEFEKELLKEKTDVTSPLPKTAYDNEGEEYVPCVGQPLSNLKPIPYEQPVFKNGKIYYGD